MSFTAVRFTRAFGVALAAALLALSAPAFAHSVKLGNLELTDLWTRATPPNAPAAGGYLTITNKGDTPDRLVKVSTPGARQGQVHEMKVTDGVMSMRELPEGLAIPAGGTVKLGPGSYHLMFIGLTEPLAVGGKLPVTLTFEKAGSIDTFLHIEAIGAQGPGGAPGAAMDHGGHTMEEKKP